jgi:hypothetical protein
MACPQPSHAPPTDARRCSNQAAASRRTSRTTRSAAHTAFYPGLSPFLTHEDGIGFNPAARTEPGFEIPAVLKLAVYRILKVRDDRNEDAVREDETAGLAFVAVNGHAGELASDGRCHMAVYDGRSEAGTYLC